MTDRVNTEVEGKILELSNLDKVLYPETGFTKAQVIDYYTRIAPVMLPHLKGRPVTMKRYPDGVEGEFFYEKECPAFHPDWVHTEPIPGTHKRPVVNYCVVDNLATLVWLANLASLELHTLLSTNGDVHRPTFMAFDLDPGEPADVLECAWAAERLRELLEDAGLESFPKTSGGKGLHLYVPLNTKVAFEETKEFAHAIARLMEKKFPERVTSVMRKDLRGGKVFIDWSQNDPHKTTVCVYSLRARPHPTVATPVTWVELDEARKHGSPGALSFEAWEVLVRADEKGDLFEGVLTLEQKLPAAP